MIVGKTTDHQNRQTLGRLCNLWLAAIGEAVPTGVVPANLSRRVAQSGVDAYRSSLDRNVLRAPRGCQGTPLGNRPVVSLRQSHFVQLLEDMRQAGLSTSMRQNVRARLIQVLKYGLQLNWTGASDGLMAVTSTVRPQSETVREATALSREQRDAFLATAAALPVHRMENALVILFYSGLRQGELLGLRWCDIDFEAGVIHVRHSLKYEKGKLVLGDVKGINTRMKAALENQKRQQNHERIVAGPQWLGGSVSDGEQFVFAGKMGGPMDPAKFSAHFKAVGEVALPGVRVHPHQTRHTYVTILREGGMDYDAIASIVGHSDGTITELIYTHLSPASKDAAFDQAEAIL
jgi:integrase